jgi:hypothetical protein
MFSVFVSRSTKPSAFSTRKVGFLTLGFACMVSVQQIVWAQATQAPKPGPSAPLETDSGLKWAELSQAQKQSLRPLAGIWDTLGAGHKRKWIALAQTYPNLAAPEQEKLHSRMVEWAALKPREREQARLNFTETKKLSAPDRASNWEAYQALSPEERQRLAADRTATKPAGAAATIKPGPPEKLTVVPITRRTPQPLRELENSKQTVDRNTLLPQAPRPTPSNVAPQN